MHRSGFVAALLIGLSALMEDAAAQTADEHVTFGPAPYVLGRLQQRLALERGEMVRATRQSIDGYLSKPEGAGPFAAVVYLHGCGGLSERTRRHFASMLTGWGYVVLAVDSFSARGLAQACDRPMPDRQADAWGAMAYLSSLPFVDRARIGIVGSSQGGIVTMRLASTHDVKIYDVPDDLTFKVAVAYYPICSVATRWLAVPTLILIGEKDDWTPAENCLQWLSLRPAKGAAVRLQVYPGAYHAFDFPALKYGLSSFGHWLQYDADAAARSTSEMQDFLAAYLGK
ncbi:dienelactone hydrolase [Bradyrhizobium oligotrophicum S58]|uniref:Dienelactone hydrolase n=1 Tax=Bradyrhizobium oligotrophicum S58 TaxID=1245469 RepID=M4ZG16_9BRAD|nr:dienelactone hydrolase family protein [Bradyrhizobium oligotrophicum]BAM92753.1 dienelactone hydrolase [Bradyrhizobium oligotrophicum S58]